MKTNDFGKRVRSHCSYLANTVELFFYNTPFFFYFNASLVCTTPLTLLLVFVSFLNVRMAFVKFYYTQNISKNEEDVLSYPKVVIEKKKFTANHGSFTQDFHKDFNEHEVFHKV